MLSYFLFWCTGFSVFPLSTVTLLNSEAVTFTCASSLDYQAFDIEWSLNGQSINLEIIPPGVNVMNRFNEMTGALSSTLRVPSTLMYDNAHVRCTLISEEGMSLSDPALLSLQCKHMKEE